MFSVQYGVKEVFVFIARKQTDKCWMIRDEVTGGTSQTPLEIWIDEQPGNEAIDQ